MLVHELIKILETFDGDSEVEVSQYTLEVDGEVIISYM